MRKQIRKEWLYGVRTKKFFIVFCIYVFLALFVPYLVKNIFPFLMSHQDIEINEMISISQQGALMMYLKNVFEMGLIIIGFVLSGIVASDLGENTLVLSISSGHRISKILIAKFIMFSGYLITITFVGFIISYLFSGTIFSFDIAIKTFIISCCLESLFIIFFISLILFIGVMTQSKIATGLLVMGTIYGMLIVGKLFEISMFLPTGVHIQANLLQDSFPTTTFFTIIITILATMSLITLSLIKLNRYEWNQR